MELVIDNFAGGGGASEGIEQAIGRPIDYALNHDAEAIAMHKANHPGTHHFCQSIWSIDPDDVVQGRPTALIWFSPDCTHHSKARGGLPKVKHIRDLAWVIPHWIRRMKKKGSAPRVIMIENVEEFQDWGPLIEDENGDLRADKERKGETFNDFCNQIRKEGYKVEFKELKACDLGAGTIRKRFFMICRCDGKPIVWPEATHGPGTPNPFVSAADNIDFSLPCPSIFTRARPLAEATCKRIATGIVRYVLEDPEPFIVPILNRNGGPAPHRVSEPMKTITASKGGDFALATPVLVGYYGDGEGRTPRNYSVEEPLRTQTTENRFGIAVPTLVGVGGRRAQSPPRSVGDPFPTSTSKADAALVTAFMAQHNTGVIGRSVKEPLATTTARATQTQVVTSHIIRMQNNCIGSSMNEPIGATMANNHYGEIRAFLIKYYGEGGQWQSLQDPMHTIPAVDRFGLVTTLINGEPYAIADIGMRMLTPRELFNANGFPRDYILDPIGPKGKPLSKTSQTAKCGNSVPPVFSRALVECNLPELCQQQRAVA